MKWLLYLNLFFLQSYLVRFHIGQYPSNLMEILIGITAVVFLFKIIRNKQLKGVINSLKKHWIIISLIILTGLSTLIVPIENSLDFIRHTKFLFFAMIMAFIFLETFRTTDERKNALCVAGYGAIVFGIFSVIYNLLGYNVAHDLRLLGPLDAAVYLAYYLAPFFIFFTIQAFKSPQDRKNIFAAIALAGLLIATKSMGAIGASFLVIIFYLFKKSDLQILKNKFTKIIIVLIGLIVIAAIFYTKIMPTIQTNYSSLDERGEIWITSMHLLKDPQTILFGTGFGQFEHHYIQNVDQVLGRQPLDYYVIQPHNIFLLFIFNYGLLGLIFIAFCIYQTIRKIFVYKGKTDVELISTFILIYFFIHGLIDTPFFKNDILFLFIIFLELGLPLKSLQSRN